jgi:hypothetical protein
MGLFRTAALAAAVLVGASAGLVAADLRDGDGSRGASTGANPSDGPDGAAGEPDPLGLGVAMENLECTKDTILIIDHGENRGALRTAVVDYPEAKYLKTSESCPTMYERVDEPRPSWVAYLGPFDIREGCLLRMAGEHRSDYLTRLQRGNESLVKCLCELSLTEDDFPVLTPDMQPTERDRVWINQLQGSLLDLGQLPAESGWPNSTYDQATIEQVNQMLETLPSREPNGVTDDAVWDIVRERVCDEYDY